MKIMLTLHHWQFMVKCDTIKIFGKLVETSSVKPNFTAVVTKGSINFGLYCRNDFTAYLFNKCRQSQTILNRVDIFFDIYLDRNIKNSTRNKRGFGKRIKVAGDTPISRHCKFFLRVSENKTQLFQILAAELIQQSNFFFSKPLFTQKEKLNLKHQYPTGYI